MAEITWKNIRAEAAGIRDMRGEILRRSGWTAETLDAEASRLQKACELADENEALRALLEIFLMREHFTISETLGPETQLRLVEAMWLRHWTGEEMRAGLADAIRRFKLQPATIPRGIEALAEIGYRYRCMKQPNRWPKRAARGRCAELMWLTDQAEDAVFQAARAAIERFELGRGCEEQALDALQQIELIFRETPFDDALPETDRRLLAETMWLRAWPLQRVLEEAIALRASLGLTGVSRPLEILHEICLRCGGPVEPNPVTEAVDSLIGDASAPRELRETVRTEFGEFRWLRQFNVAQALEKVRRYGNMTGAKPLDVFRAALDSARESYRARQADEKEKP